MIAGNATSFHTTDWGTGNLASASMWYFATIYKQVTYVLKYTVFPSFSSNASHLQRMEKSMVLAFSSFLWKYKDIINITGSLPYVSFLSHTPTYLLFDIADGSTCITEPIKLYPEEAQDVN